MPFCYGAAGLSIVADGALYGLGAPVSSTNADVRVFVNAAPHWQSDAGSAIYVSPQRSEGAPVLEVHRLTSGYHFAFADGTQFWVGSAGDAIWMTWASTLEDACTYLVGPILGLTIRLRGSFALHASAVRIGDLAIAISGRHGAGKSTVAAALGARGHEVLADDVLRLTPSGAVWMANPCGDRLRLWPDAVELVFGSGAKLPQITPSWDKRSLMLASDVGMRRFPLGGLVFLGDALSVTPVACAPLSLKQTVLHLVTHSTATMFLDHHTRAMEFAHVASIARAVPAMATARGDVLDALVDEIEAWAVAIAAPCGA